jgi:hypothetical protein
MSVDIRERSPVANGLVQNHKSFIEKHALSLFLIILTFIFCFSWLVVEQKTIKQDAILLSPETQLNNWPFSSDSAKKMLSSDRTTGSLYADLKSADHLLVYVRVGSRREEILQHNDSLSVVFTNLLTNEVAGVRAKLLKDYPMGESKSDFAIVSADKLQLDQFLSNVSGGNELRIEVFFKMKPKRLIENLFTFSNPDSFQL